MVRGTQLCRTRLTLAAQDLAGESEIAYTLHATAQTAQPPLVHAPYTYIIILSLHRPGIKRFGRYRHRVNTACPPPVTKRGKKLIHVRERCGLRVVSRRSVAGREMAERAAKGRTGDNG